MSGSKINVAKQTIEFLHRKLSSEMILGIGTGTTVNFFIEKLKHINTYSKVLSPAQKGLLPFLKKQASLSMTLITLEKYLFILIALTKLPMINH